MQNAHARVLTRRPLLCSNQEITFMYSLLHGLLKYPNGASPGNSVSKWHHCYHMSLFTLPLFGQPIHISWHLVAVFFTPHSGNQSVQSPAHHTSNNCDTHCSAASFLCRISHWQHHYQLCRMFNLTTHQPTNFSYQCLDLSDLLCQTFQFCWTHLG